MAVRFSITQRMLRPDLTEFILKKHDGELTPTNMGIFSSHQDAIREIDIIQNYPKQLPPHWYNEHGQKIGTVTLVDHTFRDDISSIPKLRWEKYDG